MDKTVENDEDWSGSFSKKEIPMDKTAGNDDQSSEITEHARKLFQGDETELEKAVLAMRTNYLEANLADGAPLLIAPSLHAPPVSILQRTT